MPKFKRLLLLCKFSHVENFGLYSESTLTLLCTFNLQACLDYKEYDTMQESISILLKLIAYLSKLTG